MAEVTILKYLTGKRPFGAIDKENDTIVVKSIKLGGSAGSEITLAVVDGKLDKTGGAMTGAIAMGTNKITGLASGTDANDAINKAQLDSALTGLSWKEPVQVKNLIGNASVATINGLSPAKGDAYVFTDAGTPTAGSSDAFAAGDIGEFDGTSWKRIVDNSSGYVPSGTRAILSTSAALITPYTDATDDGKIVSFSGSSNTGTDTGDAVNGKAVLVQDPDNIPASIYNNLGYVFNGIVPTGSWTQFTGAGQINAGDGMTKDGNTLNVGAGDGIQVDADSVTVKLDGSTLTKSASGLKVSDAGISETQISSDSLLSTGGLQGGSSTKLSIKKDTTGGANLARVINLSANGLAILVDNTSIEENGSGQLGVKTDGINDTHIDFGTGANQVADNDLPSVHTAINYTPTQEGSEGTDKVSAHIKGIDTKLGELGSKEYSLIAGENLSQNNVCFIKDKLVIAATNKYIDFKEDTGGGLGSELTATLTELSYKGDALATHIAARMNAAGGDTNYACTFDPATNKFTITNNSIVELQLLWSTGTNAANSVGTTIGFSVAADDTSATSYEADNTNALGKAFKAQGDSDNNWGKMLLLVKDASISIGVSGAFYLPGAVITGLTGIEFGDARYLSQSSAGALTDIDSLANAAGSSQILILVGLDDEAKAYFNPILEMSF